MMPFEAKAKLAGLACLSTIAVGVFALGTWKAIEGSTIYLMAAEGRTYWEGLMYAGMISGMAILASSASVHIDHKGKSRAFLALAIALALLTIWTTHQGKLHDSYRQIDDSRQAERQDHMSRIREYSQNITRLNESLAKMSQNLSNRGDSPAVSVPTCTKGQNYYQSCMAQRDSALKAIAAQSKSAATRQKEANTSQQQLIDALERAKSDLAHEKGALAVFDTETSRKKAEKQHDSLLTNAISAIMPEVASLLGSFFLNFFGKAMYMIMREKHAGQFAGQLRDSCGTVRDGWLSQTENGMTRSENEQWSVLGEMSPVQQTAKTPMGAEAELVEAITQKTAPLSTRAAKSAFPLVAKHRVPEIFEEQFAACFLNRRKNARGGYAYEYPPDGEEGGNTFVTETAAARMAAPTQRSIYLAINNGATA